MSDRFDAVAAAVQRLAVLTAAGIPAAPAWRHLAASTDDPVVRAAVEGLDSPRDLPGRIAAAAAGTAPETERSAWSALAAIWSVATESGAPLAPALDRSAEVLRSLGQSAREVETALAGPVATSRIVLALPAVAVLLGAMLGFDLVGAFVSVPGALCLGGGAALIVAAVRWNRGLLHWARDLDASPGLGFDLLAIAMSGGLSIERASGVVADACALSGVTPPGDEVREVLAFSAAAGVPAVALLRAEADHRRRAARAEAAARAVRLESRMLLPLGLCILPAFVLLGVAPMGLAILSSTAVPF